MKPFKFFRGDTLPEVNLEIVSREVQMFARSTEHIPAGFVYVPIIPYDIRTPEGEHWSNRENESQQP